MKNLVKRKKTIDELKKDFDCKIDYLDEIVKNALQKPLGSKLREEYANSIAVELRLLYCYVSGSNSLCNRCGYDDQLLFPLYSPIAAQSLVPQYNLVNCTWDNDHKTGMFSVRDDLGNPDIVWCTMMTFNNWKSEVVIDFLSDDFKPLSRENIIRLVADKQGAHVDSIVDGRLVKIIEDEVFPVRFVDNDKTYYGEGRNLFTETIIGIAIETIRAYRYTKIQEQKKATEGSGIIYYQDYGGVFKYTVCKVKINAYNANQHFSCLSTEKELKHYNIKFKDKYFNIGIID